MIQIRNKMRKTAVLWIGGLCLFFFVLPLQAQNFIPIWPKDKMPNSKGKDLKDSIVNERYYRVGTPGIYAFFPSKQANTGTAVLICPGGGYSHITYKMGGFARAKWLNVLGINAFVLIYRLPNQPSLKHRALAPLQDAQRAMSLIRFHAKEWKIHPDKIGVMGASAGGHVAAMVGTETKDVSDINDKVSTFPFRPDFMVLVSPVITMGKYAHEGSRENLLGKHPTDKQINQFSAENRVTSKTPPCLIADAFNDHVVDPHNSLLFYKALLHHKISTSFHVFPQGDHAIALTNNPGSAAYWADLWQSWLQEMEFLPTN